MLLSKFFPIMKITSLKIQVNSSNRHTEEIGRWEDKEYSLLRKDIVIY